MDLSTEHYIEIVTLSTAEVTFGIEEEIEVEEGEVKKTVVVFQKFVTGFNLISLHLDTTLNEINIYYDTRFSETIKFQFNTSQRLFAKEIRSTTTTTTLDDDNEKTMSKSIATTITKNVSYPKDVIEIFKNLRKITPPYYDVMQFILVSLDIPNLDGKKKTVYCRRIQYYRQKYELEWLTNPTVGECHRLPSCIVNALLTKCSVEELQSMSPKLSTTCFDKEALIYDMMCNLNEDKMKIFIDSILSRYTLEELETKAKSLGIDKTYPHILTFARYICVKEEQRLFQTKMKSAMDVKQYVEYVELSDLYDYKDKRRDASQMCKTLVDLQLQIKDAKTTRDILCTKLLEMMEDGARFIEVEKQTIMQYVNLNNEGLLSSHDKIEDAYLEVRQDIEKVVQRIKFLQNDIDVINNKLNLNKEAMIKLHISNPAMIKDVHDDNNSITIYCKDGGVPISSG